MIFYAILFNKIQRVQQEGNRKVQAASTKGEGSSVLWGRLTSLVPKVGIPGMDDKNGEQRIP